MKSSWIEWLRGSGERVLFALISLCAVGAVIGVWRYAPSRQVVHQPA